MIVAKQLYQLQDVDLELESTEQAINRIVSQLGDNKVVVETRNKLNSGHQRLKELARQQHSTEGEIEGIISKLSSAGEELYSGRIRNPKELANLQHEIDGLKTNRSQLEDKTLEVMDQVEAATKSVTTIDSKLKVLEAEWQSQQQQLSVDLEQLKTVLSKLQNKRQLLITDIDSQVVEVYSALKKQKGTAVAKVEQGICHGCRISLPVRELAQIRSGSLVRCSSCGRILFLA